MKKPLRVGDIAVTFGDGLMAKAHRTARARRDICGPRGSCRLVGPIVERRLGDKPYPTQECADCGAWNVVS